MDQISIDAGIAKALDALNANRLALLCGAGLSLAPPSSLPSAAALALKAKQKYSALFGTDRPPLPDSIDDQAQFFYERHELNTVYLRTYIGKDDFSASPNSGHFAAADLLLTGGINIAVSTNVDTLIETAGTILLGQVGVGVSRDVVAALPPERSPLLKIHGCWTNPAGTIWAVGQLEAEPNLTRIAQNGQWLSMKLLDRDLIIVGYWTDWDYLNQVLERTLGEVTPTRVIVIDPCETSSFAAKAPALYDLGNRATAEFCHVSCSGDQFLNRLRVEFSRGFIRTVLHSGRAPYTDHTGAEAEAGWLNPNETDADILWRIRRDLEGCNPNQPALRRTPSDESLVGMTILQLRARGAMADGQYWKLGETRVRVLRSANRPLHEVEAAFERETAPAIAADITIAVGSESIGVPTSIARGSGGATIARGSSGRWLSRGDAISELGL